ncbi:phosphotransferase family protein [Microtetraspora malaysiensis]|uniref:Phosphotransferase family protein n=1 Tax=Microtetraspora malaysiensis TaxID=161358 RepID=A0ABW6SPW3_9ACTN
MEEPTRSQVPSPPVEPLRSVAEMTPGWCSAALSRRFGGARVTGVTTAAVGTGQMADTYRLHLDYSPAGAGPATVIAKLAAASPASRTAAKVTRAYEVEARFYQHLAPTLPVRSPRCYLSRYDEPSGAFTLLLEDAVDGHVADQVTGCGPEEAERAVDQLAALHGPMWGDPALDSLAWLPRHDGPDAAWMASLAQRIYPRFLRRFGDRLDAEVVDLLEFFVPRVERYLRARPGPRTVVHGDFRADNLVVGTGRITVLDWQTAAHEPAATDLAYFLGGSVEPDRRRAVEGAVLRRYVRALRGYGVELSFEDCWRDYRRYAFGGLLTSLVASALVVRTDRGDGLFATMANRHGMHAIDLDAASFLR